MAKGIKNGYIKCLECKRQFSSKKSYAHHKHDALPENYCMYCRKLKKKSKMAEHLLACEKRIFIRYVWPKLKFFARQVGFYNLGIRGINYLGRTNERKAFIKRYMKMNQLLFFPNKGTRRHICCKEVNRRANEAIEETKKKYNLRNGLSSIHIQILTDIDNDLFPSVSAREYIFKYLKEHNFNNYKIINFINKQLKRKDYFTDEEIKVNSLQKFIKLNNLRIVYDFGNTREYLDSLMKQIHEEVDSIKCKYCDKYLKDMKRHYKHCEGSMQAFNNNKEKYIFDYISQFYNSYKLKENEPADAAYYFSHFDFETFHKNIGLYLKSHRVAIARIEREEEIKKNKKIKEELKKNPRPKFNAKKWVDDFTREFDEERKKENRMDLETTVEEKIEAEEENESIENIIEKENGDDILIKATPIKNKCNMDPINFKNIPKINFEISDAGKEFLKNNIGCNPNAGKKKVFKFLINNPFKK